MIYLADYITQMHCGYSKDYPGKVLESWYRMILGNKGEAVMDTVVSGGLRLFLDSGAFSAWSKGIQINLQEYISFCKRYEALLEVMAVLDVIPGGPGRSPTPEEIELAAQTSWDNYQTMLEAGLPKDKLLPCFHYGEDWRWLRKYMEVTDYVALGAMAKLKEDARTRWLDFAMRILCDEQGLPAIRFHGFGMTSFFLMRRYPWYSVDSTSWVLNSRFGTIYVPLYRNGRWIYSRDPWKVVVSDKSPKIKDAGVHFNTWPEPAQAVIREYVESKGFTIEGAGKDYKVRDQLNIIYYKDFEKALPKWPWAMDRARQTGVFF